ncbi:transposase [Streptomyces mirabilis]|uniref:IS110 family transposase n=1 Tax=Streptomyces mirabilis TaxID=68239 RepID=UPI00364A5652
MTVTSMPQPTLPTQRVPGQAEEVILGVDTHKDVHVAAVITTLGASLAHQEFPETAVGYRQLLAWGRSFGVLLRAGVECTGSYGTALTRSLRREGIDVVEINQPDRATRRKRGKTDAVDADAAARAVLSGRATPVPKSADGPAADMRVLRLAKESAVKARTQALNQLKAVLLAIDPDLRELLTGLSNPGLVATCAALDADDQGQVGRLHDAPARPQSPAPVRRGQRAHPAHHHGRPRLSAPDAGPGRRRAR